MKTKLVPEVLEQASKLKTKKEKIAYLQSNVSPALKDIIRVQFDDDIVSNLPEGSPPYQKDDAPIGHAPSSLHKQHKKFKYWFKGPVSNGMQAMKRETTFIRCLESLHSSEAELLVLAKDKKMKYTGITKKLCQDAFPGLIAK